MCIFTIENTPLGNRKCDLLKNCVHGYRLPSVSLVNYRNLCMFCYFRYFQWLFGQINGVIEDDIRSLFLLALQEVIYICSDKQLFLSISFNKNRLIVTVLLSTHNILMGESFQD